MLGSQYDEISVAQAAMLAEPLRGIAAQLTSQLAAAERADDDPHPAARWNHLQRVRRLRADLEEARTHLVTLESLSAGRP